MFQPVLTNPWNEVPWESKRDAEKPLRVFAMVAKTIIEALVAQGHPEIKERYPVELLAKVEHYYGQWVPLN